MTLRWKDYRVEGPTRLNTMTLEAGELMRRCLLHVPPSRVHRIRHYGLLANACRRANIAQARQFLQPTTDASSGAKAAAHETAPPGATCVCRPFWPCDQRGHDPSRVALRVIRQPPRMPAVRIVLASGIGRGRLPGRGTLRRFEARGLPAATRTGESSLHRELAKRDRSDRDAHGSDPPQGQWRATCIIHITNTASTPSFHVMLRMYQGGAAVASMSVASRFARLKCRA